MSITDEDITEAVNKKQEVNSSISLNEFSELIGSLSSEGVKQVADAALSVLSHFEAEVVILQCLNRLSVSEIKQFSRNLIRMLPAKTQVTLFDNLFSDYAQERNLFDCDKFISKSLKAMQKLEENGKNNLVSKFARGIADERPESNESLFPLNRMPFGLVEYQIEFFTATHVQQVFDQYRALKKK